MQIIKVAEGCLYVKTPKPKKHVLDAPGFCGISIGCTNNISGSYHLRPRRKPKNQRSGNPGNQKRSGYKINSSTASKNAAEKSTAGTGGGPPKADCEAMEAEGPEPRKRHTQGLLGCKRNNRPKINCRKKFKRPITDSDCKRVLPTH